MEKFRNPGIHHILLSMQSFFSVQYVVIYNTFREWCSKRYANQYSFLDHIGLGGGEEEEENLEQKIKRFCSNFFFFFWSLIFLSQLETNFFLQCLYSFSKPWKSLITVFLKGYIAAYYITCCIFFKLKYIRTKQFFKHFYDNIIWLKLKSGNTLRVCVPDLG